MPAIFLAILGYYNMVPAWLKKAVAAVLIVFAIFAAGEIRGKRIARAECEAQAKRAQNAADAQDLAAEREGRAQDLQITDALTQQKKVDDETIEKLKQQLAKSPGASCLYDKSTADPDDPPRRLRH